MQHITIIGGSTSSLLLAISLLTTTQDYHITILECKDSFQLASIPGRDIALNYRTLKTLQKIHCEQSNGTISNLFTLLKEHLSPIKNILVKQEASSINLDLKAQEQDLNCFGAVIALDTFNKILYEQAQKLANIELFTNVQIKYVHKTPTCNIIEYKQDNDNYKLDVDLVIVTAMNAIPGLANQSNILDFKQTALITSVSLTKEFSALAIEYFAENGPVAFLPQIANNKQVSDKTNNFALVYCEQQEKIAEIKENPELLKDKLNAILQQYPALQAQVKELQELTSYPLKRSNQESLIEQRLIYLGAAAHNLHPVTGQGFNLIVRAIESLTNILKDNPEIDYNTPSLYAKEHTITMEKMVSRTDFLARVFKKTNLVSLLSSNLFFLHLQNNKKAQKKFILNFLGYK